MTITLAGQTAAFLYSCALGAGLCVVYDVFRAIRMFFCPGRTVVVLLDVLYFFSAAVLTFAFFMAVSQGEARAYLYFGELIGWLLYYETIGSLLFRLQRGFFVFLRKTARKLTAPIRRFAGKLAAFGANRPAETPKGEKKENFVQKKITFRGKSPCNSNKE